MKKILLLSGEESGLAYARQIAEGLGREYEIRGYSDYGFSIADLAVMGFWPVIKKLFFFMRVRRVMLNAVRSWRPDIVVTVDYPGMNIPIAEYSKKLGIRTLHVVSPQVWAWKKGKIPRIQKAFDRLCCFFPFEPPYYKRDFAVFVGHPLFDDFRNISSLERDESLLAVLPGSRVYEIERHMPILVKAIELLQNKNLKIVIPAANARARKALEKFAKLMPKVEIIDGGARELLCRARCAVVASGTATLEAALARCPTVLVYKVGPITEFILRRMIKGTKYAGLANVIWDKCAGKGQQPMPELLQADFTPENVCEYLSKWLTDDVERRQSVERLDNAMSLLHSDGCAINRIVKEVVSL
ncbi:MAG: lipid-A-disaccharide synthase [Kiritimatiellae bacterium]|nr:lipid-A-disaccharide synthase [Kiritimatiellia bacterium]